MRRSTLRAAVVAVTAGLALTACGSSGGTSGTSGTSGGGANAATATSAQALGGMDALVTAAKKEGTLNVIALPPSWANYGAMLKAFTAKYGININSANPDGTSQQEIDAVTSQKGQSRAPDVIDVGGSFAVQAAAQNLLAPYQVATWGDIPANQKDAKGNWYNDYGGFISIACNMSKVKKCPTTLKELTDPQYAKQVTLNGNPTKATAAFSGVWAASLANGGSFDDIGKGIDFFKKIKAAGNFNPVDPTGATLQSGETPVVIDWDYSSAGQVASSKKAGITLTVNVPTDGLYGSFYDQAISKFAPHPAAARLWEEFLYSDEGQNIWLQGASRPVRLPAMQKAGTADAAALKALPAVQGTAAFPTEAQVTAAQKVIADRWNSEMSG
ncbi:MAG: putative spermidine/putrescine transport system substrate-binding protein [Blastococcus sp.]|nr:putative spermidine/putrescine transport system substrate-binding protein [Blastococcus sp.]